MSVAEAPLLEVREVRKQFDVSRFGGEGAVHAVNGVTFGVHPREVLGLVGESGCGKSTLGRLMLRLLTPTSGSVLFDGRDITRASHRELIPVRRQLQVIFQDPYASLNPLMTVDDLLTEPLRTHKVLPRRAQGGRVRELLELVGLPATAMKRRPSEFSGGQQQRVAIARALAVEPRLIVADEALSALDVSIQAQILNLFLDVQERLGISYVFISHNLAVVRHISHRVAVMYLGKVVEIADAETLYARPRHPYTQALLSALPVADPDVERARRRRVLPGDPPTPTRIPSGCPLHTRCWLATERCATEVPALREIEPGHRTACHHAERSAADAEAIVVPTEGG